MNQIFRPDFNTIAKVSVFVALYLVASLIWILIILDRSNYTRRVNEPIPQPVAYSHQLHAGSLGMNCQYCHTAVTLSAAANIPSTETCMTCHHEIKTNSLEIQKVRASYDEDTPIEWIRVHDLPDHVYFNHSIHVNKGMGCSECHGRVDQMDVVWRVKDLTMGWCLDCHRAPEKYIRPRDEVFNMQWTHPENQRELGQQLVREYNIAAGQLDHCNICHR